MIKAKEGSVLSTAIPVSDLPEDFIKMALYGENGVGKTSLACQFPKPLLLVSFEPARTGGAKSVQRVPGVHYLRPETVEKAVELCRELSENCQFKTVVVDSATSLQDRILADILGVSKLPEMLAWGSVTRDQYRERSERTRELLRPFLNLSCHTVVIAKQKDHNVQDKDKVSIIRSFTIESFFGVNLGGETAGWLHDACDNLCQLSIQKEVKTKRMKVGTEVEEMEYETGKTVRRLRCKFHPNYAARLRASDPDKVPEFLDDPTYEKLKRIIDGV